jgi:hypothetical protein
MVPHIPIPLPRGRVEFLCAGFALVLCVSTASPLHAEEYDWAQRFGGGGSDRVECVAVDADRNVIMVGSFSGDANFGGGVLSTGGSDDVFVAKYDHWGYHLWSRRFGGNNNDRARAVAVDADGNVIVVGYFLGAIDFGGASLTSAGLDDIFVVRLDAYGHHVWSRRFGAGNNDHADHVALDADGNIAVTGYMRGSVDFGGGAITSAGAADGFVAALDNTGTHLWSRGFGSTFDDGGTGVAADPSGNIFVTGSFQDEVSFGGPALASAGLSDIFIAKYDAAGGHLWSTRFGDGNFQTGSRLAADAAGNIVVVGSFFGTVDFGGGGFTSSGLWDGFVAAYDGAGNYRWSRSFGSGFDDHAWDVAITPDGDVAVSGEFGGSADVGGGTMTSVGLADAFAAVYDADDNFLWGRHYGDTGADIGRGVAVDGPGAVLFAGEFRDTIDVDTDSLESAGQNDVYLARYWTQTLSAATSPSPGAVDVRVYPNPFNPATSIEYTVAASGPVTIDIYDVAGRRVATVLDGSPRDPGAYVERFRPDGLASGVYFVRVETPSGTVSRSVTLLK